MKPLEILVAIPKWATATPDQILDSPAFAMPCRLGEEQVSLRLGAVQPGDTLDLAILFGDEPHSLRLARSPRFPELDKVWDSRADVPEPILLALVEKECGPLLQLLENAVRRQLRLVGLAANSDPDARMVFAQVNDVVFSLTRSETVTAAFGILRHLDFASPELRSETFTAETEYAAFALAAADLASLSVGDALLVPEIGSVPPRLVVDGRFAVDESGVSPFADDGRCRVVAAEMRTVSLGELFDAAENPRRVEGEAPGQLRLMQSGKKIANGRLERLGEQPAFVVESPAS
jgi:hypothetical protein